MAIASIAAIASAGSASPPLERCRDEHPEETGEPERLDGVRRERPLALALRRAIAEQRGEVASAFDDQAANSSASFV